MSERRFLIPDFEGSAFQKWAKNYCSKNQWRVRNVLGDYEDCMAFCAMSYVICSQNYGNSVNEARQFMYMYQLWVCMEFNTMSVKDSRQRQLKKILPQNEPVIDSDSDMTVKLGEASSELKSILNIFLDAPKEILEILREDANSCHPKQFFKAVVEFCKIPKSRSVPLAKELQMLLK